MDVNDPSFPVLYQSFRCDNPYLRMVLATYKKECKVRTHTFTVFRWQLPGRTERYKKPEICQTYSKLKNICQVCQVDLDNGLPVQDRDNAPNITTHKKEKHFSAIEEDINRKTFDKYFANGEESRKIGRTSELSTWMDSVLLKEKNTEATRQSVRLRTKRPSNIFENKGNTSVAEFSRKGNRWLVKPRTSRNLINFDSGTVSDSNRHEYSDEQRRNSPVNNENVKDCAF
ncbi:hypothetical protein Bca52824_042599 [Brassica carinata]|uniref:STL11/RBM22-like N-terminal domain-containing protein n=1 Tax=Brassica carinata TaxID=52824 RepID=A0A8X7RZI7_BRACI|nr:hypothetical protein Bca52824_042599 [Brassica carinata]